jgi:hypothetical protein
LLRSKVLQKTFSTKIRLGDHILSTNPDCDSNVCSLPYQEYSVVQAIIHPLYGVGGKFRNDIAILQLDFPAQLNRSLMLCPACLVVLSVAATNQLVNKVALVASTRLVNFQASAAIYLSADLQQILT